MKETLTKWYDSTFFMTGFQLTSVFTRGYLNNETCSLYFFFLLFFYGEVNGNLFLKKAICKHQLFFSNLTIFSSFMSLVCQDVWFYVYLCPGWERHALARTYTCHIKKTRVVCQTSKTSFLICSWFFIFYTCNFTF